MHSSRGARADRRGARYALTQAQRGADRRKWGPPLVCDESVTIAKEVKLKAPEENIGAQMIKKVAIRTNDIIGDGTNTATLLAYAVFSEALRNMVAGSSATLLKRGLDKCTVMAVEHMRSLSEPIGQLVADALNSAGDAGVVSVEEAKDTETYTETVEGMQFDRGYLSPYFVNQKDKM
jgi:chaperonin GroEL